MAADFPSTLQMSATSLRHSCPIFTTHILTPAVSFQSTSGGGCSPLFPFRISMAKGKDIRITVTLECIGCVRSKAKGVSRYVTEKNRHNTPNRIELKKFCPYCNKHTVHGEIKK